MKISAAVYNAAVYERRQCIRVVAVYLHIGEAAAVGILAAACVGHACKELYRFGAREVLLRIELRVITNKERRFNRTVNVNLAVCTITGGRLDRRTRFHSGRGNRDIVLDVVHINCHIAV